MEHFNENRIANPCKIGWSTLADSFPENFWHNVGKGDSI